MSENVLKVMTEKMLKLKLPVSQFCWQGGEPTLMGLNFFQSAVQLQMELGRGGQSVSNAIQTNGLLIDPDWAAFLAEYRFLVGVSLDGPSEIHDRYRGDGTHRRVMQATKTLADAGVEFNILTVVNRVNQDRGAQTYRWLRDQGFAYLQFIPAVETDEKGAPLPFAATPEGYGRFLCEVFDAWRKEGGPGKVYVRFFESVICHLAGAPAGSCLFGNRCDHYLVVEHTGDVHPCDFFVRSDLRIGNILEADFPDLTDRTVRKTFARAKGKLPEPCKTCRFLTLCRGGCLKDRERACGNFSCPSYLCPSYKLFYSHSLDWFRQTVRRLQSPRPAKPSRNQPCPCGSDRKYKHCCGK